MNQNSSRPTNPRSSQQSRDSRPSYSSDKKRPSNDSRGSNNSYNSQGNSSYSNSNSSQGSSNGSQGGYSSQGNGYSSQGERSSRPSYQGNSNGGGRSSYGSSSQGGRSSYGSQGGYGGGRNRRPAKRNTLDISAFINKVTADTTPAVTFVPKHQFADLNLNPDLLKNLEFRGYAQPTPIQDAVIPQIINNNQDLVGLANTGTGKTGAFLIPLINKALANKDQQTLILAPTRELAVQIEKEFYLFSHVR